MKLNMVKVPKFIQEDVFGRFEFSDVEILFDPEVKEITADNFNQDEDEYFLDDSQIKKLSIESAIRFYNERVKEVFQETKPLTSFEVRSIRDFFGISGADLGKLIGMDKSSISRVVNGKQLIMPDKARSLMTCLKGEIDSPGYCKIVLSNLAPKCFTDMIQELNFDVVEIAEYLIKQFEDLESSISQLKLQKLIYYAQGIGFGRYGVKLFNGPLLAWEHGPVVRLIFDRYTNLGKAPLSYSADVSLEMIENNEIVLNILEETIALYGIYDAWHLRTKTHNESPWLETPRDDVISDEKMISFFRKIFV